MADAWYEFADLDNTTLADWVGVGPSSLGFDYTSYLNTSFQPVEDTMFHYQTPYLYVYLQNQIPNTADAPAATMSCLFRGGWDWANNVGVSPSFTHEEECYRYRKNQDVAVSRRKLRGRGRVLQLRFTSNARLDFQVLGWGMPVGKNTDP